MKVRPDFLLLALLAGVLFGCAKEGAKDEHDHESSEKAEVAGEHSDEAGAGEDIVLTPEAAKIAGIEVGEARLISVQGELKVPGTVTNTSNGRAIVSPPVAGKITQLYVKVGDRVMAGQPIATLQSADLADAAARMIQAQQLVITAQAAVREAQSQFNLAQTKVRSASAVLNRQLAFAKTGAFSQPALQAAQKDLADAEAELERGKQDQALHQAQLERAERLYNQELISRTELEQARLEVSTDKIRQRNAERKIELAKTTYDRERRIAEQGLANSREIQTAEAELRSANLEVEQARIRLGSARAGVASANKGVHAALAAYRAQAGGSRANGGSVTVSAPIGGVVTDRVVTLGQAVERATEICEIENLKSVWVMASVPEKQIATVRTGSRSQFTVAAYPNRVFVGVVQVVGSRLDPKTRTMPVQILVDNASGALRADMFAIVALGVGGTNQAIAVPRSAIVADGDRKLVYIAEDGGKYEEKVVVTGRAQGEFVEIVSGLEAGARIVVKGAFVLKSEKVKGELKGHEH